LTPLFIFEDRAGYFKNFIAKALLHFLCTSDKIILIQADEVILNE
jgi:hypothetical protein